MFTFAFNIRSVKCPPPPPNPIAVFIVNPSPTYVDQATTFDASASVPGYNGTDICPITEYSWVFGDGNTTTIATPIIYHTYSKIGNYTVTLTVVAPGSPVENDSRTSLVKVLALPTVGGISITTGLGSLVSYICLISTLALASVAIAVCIRRVKRTQM